MWRRRWAWVGSAGLLGGTVLLSVLSARGAEYAPVASDATTIETLLRGIEARGDQVGRLTGVLGLEGVSSPGYRAEVEARQEAACDEANRGVTVAFEPRSLAVMRFSIEGPQMGWQACCLTPEAADDWGLGNRYYLLPPHDLDPLGPGDLASAGYTDGEVVYRNDGIVSPPVIRPLEPWEAPAPFEPLGYVRAHFVEGWSRKSLDKWRERADFTLLGQATLAEGPCSVLAAVGRAPDSRGASRRLWVCPERGFGILRMEHIEVGTDFGPASAALYTAADWREYAEGLWLPRLVRIDHWSFAEGPARWDWSKRFLMAELDVNTGFHWTTSDLLFPVERSWADVRPGAKRPMPWDGGQGIQQQFEAEDLAFTEPEPFGDTVPTETAEPDVWRAWGLRPLAHNG